MRELTRPAMRYWCVACLALVACGGGDAPEPEMAEEPTSEESAAPMSAGPRVFFIAPEDGEMYPAGAPVAFEFGVENYELGAVPEEFDQPRGGIGHFHLGVDTDCLPAGEIIPQGDPWVHFGDASTTIEMMLEQGEHTLALQFADDEHRTLADDGLCETITIYVEEGI